MLTCWMNALTYSWNFYITAVFSFGHKIFQRFGSGVIGFFHFITCLKGCSLLNFKVIIRRLLPPSAVLSLMQSVLMLDLTIRFRATVPGQLKSGSMYLLGKKSFSWLDIMLTYRVLLHFRVSSYNIAACGFQKTSHMMYFIFVERLLLQEWWFCLAWWRKIIWQLDFLDNIGLTFAIWLLWAREMKTEND